MISCTRKITEQIVWVGGNDRRLQLFENLFPLPNGVSYNSYLILDEKTVLLDTVDSSITAQFLENIKTVLAGRKLDYLVINHMEPDHCANIEELMIRYPEIKLVGNAKTFQMVSQFYGLDLNGRVITVTEGEELNTGSHTLRFYMTPMVHWPEVMMTYEVSQKILFSADAFGSFGTLDGNIFYDEIEINKNLIDELRRYYVNIVGKFGTPVQAAMKKLNNIPIEMICPLHGPVWRKDLDKLLKLYGYWSSYEPEENALVICYASMYGNTENAVEAFAASASVTGIKNIVIYDVSKTHISYLMAELFRCSHFVLASPTYNSGLFPAIEELLADMKALNLQNRTAVILENASWAGTAAKQIRAKLEELKNIIILDPSITIKSTAGIDISLQMDQICSEIAKSMKQ